VSYLPPKIQLFVSKSSLCFEDSRSKFSWLFITRWFTSRICWFFHSFDFEAALSLRLFHRLKVCYPFVTYKTLLLSTIDFPRLSGTTIVVPIWHFFVAQLLVVCRTAFRSAFIILFFVASHRVRDTCCSNCSGQRSHRKTPPSHQPRRFRALDELTDNWFRASETISSELSSDFCDINSTVYVLPIQSGPPTISW